MSEEELMQVAVAISAIGLVGIEETEEVAIELTALTKLGARFPDLRWRPQQGAGSCSRR